MSGRADVIRLYSDSDRCDHCGDVDDDLRPWDDGELCYACWDAEVSDVMTEQGLHRWQPSSGKQAASRESRPLKFLTSAQLREVAPAEVDWVWSDYLAARGVTLLAGKPKAGKSTLAVAVARAVASGATFLDRPTRKGNVLYVTEEGDQTVIDKLVDDDPGIYWLTRDQLARNDAWPRPEWADLLGQVDAAAGSLEASLVVIDTAAFWAGLGAEQEKDAGAVQQTMAGALELASRGVAVLLVHHTRKGGGEDGEGIRGSSAFAGAVDVILELDRIAGQNPPPRHRVLSALSRYTQTPGALVIDHDATTNAWTAVGTAEHRRDTRALTDRAAIVRALTEAPEPLTRAELEKALDGAPAKQWHTVLTGLVDAGEVGRDGAGKKGDPYRYRMLRNPPAHHSRSNGAGPLVDGGALPVGKHHHEQPRNGSSDAAQKPTEANSPEDAWLKANGYSREDWEQIA